MREKREREREEREYRKLPNLLSPHLSAMEINSVKNSSVDVKEVE